MPTELQLPLGYLWGFLLTMARVGAMFVFVPIPGAQASPAAARIVLTLVLTTMVAGLRSSPRLAAFEPGAMTLALLSESALGLVTGLLVGVLSECFSFGAQVLSLQAGFSYASTIDPTNQTDTGILTVLAQLLSGFLFFTSGVDRLLVGALAESMRILPEGAFPLKHAAAEEAIHATSVMFTTGLRYALPVIGLLFLVDLALALAGRVSPQLQLLAMAFPVKTSLCFLAGAATLSVAPSLYEGVAMKLAASAAKLLLAR